jgi:hypothetical protein
MMEILTNLLQIILLVIMGIIGLYCAYDAERIRKSISERQDKNNEK